MSRLRTKRRAVVDDGAESPRARASALIDKIRLDPDPKLYGGGEDWLFLHEVRTSTGCPEGLRRADAIALRMTPANAPWELLAFEVKLDAEDLERELHHPEKAPRSASSAGASSS